MSSKFLELEIFKSMCVGATLEVRKRLHRGGRDPIWRILLMAGASGWTWALSHLLTASPSGDMGVTLREIIRKASTSIPT